MTAGTQAVRVPNNNGWRFEQGINNKFWDWFGVVYYRHTLDQKRMDNFPCVTAAKNQV
jgi:hypothetical protein